MAVENNLPRNLPTDLIIEIFSRLPSKSIARFRCLSKRWASIFKSPSFTELFLTQSATRPRLLFAVEKSCNVWYLYSSPQPQNSSRDPNSSLSVTAEFLMSFSNDCLLNISTPMLGLIYCYNLSENLMLCNPSSRCVLSLPLLTSVQYSYIGYDPIDKQVKILAIAYPLSSQQDLCYYILKLGSGRLSWRNIECPLKHYPLQIDICINGIFYYIATLVRYDFRLPSRKIVCFNLNSEEFKFIDHPCRDQLDVLVNFKGKLSGISIEWVKVSKRIHLELRVWVLEDIETQEWSKHVYVLPSRLWNKKFPRFSIIGVTATGEVVLSLRHLTNPLYVYFFNLEKNILRKVEIKGFEGVKLHSILYGCVGYVDGCVGYVEGLDDRILN